MLFICIETVTCPLPRYTQAVTDNLHQDTADLIRSYFDQMYTQMEIVAALATCHGICMSIRTLKRALRRMGLKKHNVATADSMNNARIAIVQENCTSGQMLG